MLNNIRADLRRYPGSGLRRFAMAALSQGFWAVFSYRIGHSLRMLPRPLRILATLFWVPISKLMECATGIEIGSGASIGPGLYIGHFGCIIVSGRATIGKGCNLSQGVTIGVAGRAGKRGVPVIG